ARARAAGKPVFVEDCRARTLECRGKGRGEAATGREAHRDRRRWRFVAGVTPHDRRTSPLEKTRRQTRWASEYGSIGFFGWLVGSYRGGEQTASVVARDSRGREPGVVGCRRHRSIYS